MIRFSPFAVIGAAVTAVTVSTAAFGQVDTISILVDGSTTVGGVSPSSALGTFGYLPASATGTTDVFYAAGFSGTGQDIRSIAYPLSGSPPYTRLITATAWQMFDKAGDLGNGGGTPTPGSFTFNKTAIGSIGAYKAAFIADGTGNTTVGGTVNPSLSQKIYRYNLAQDTNGDGRDEFTSLVTLAQMQSAINSTNTSTNVGRQLALSTDSSKLYFIDISSVYGGLWSVPTVGGTVTRLVADASQNIEPSVVRAGGVDRVIINGTALATSNNTGGLDYYDTSTGQRGTQLAAATLADFLETTAANITISSTTTDADGNLYFLNSKGSSSSVPERRGVYRLDPQGHLSKVYSFAERTSVTGGTNSNAFRLQTRTTTINGVPVTQVLYEEPSSVNAIAAANAFLPGDFNRDGLVNQVDIGLFKTKLTVRGVATPLADARYDLNGNNVVDWKDVKALQQFTAIKNGDADMDYDVDFTDLSTLATNYGATSGKTWLAGDFTGDDAVNYSDLLVLVGNYDTKPTYPTLSVGGVFTQPFIDDYNRAIAAVVPEPTTLAALAGVAAVTLRRRRKA